VNLRWRRFEIGAKSKLKIIQNTDCKSPLAPLSDLSLQF
jgi:hypothetical protein